jgi:predicted DNA-binding transcriptional regulator AlpA
MESKPTLLTRQEAADRTGLSAKWLQNAAWRGDGPPMYRFTKRTSRYLSSDLDAWVAGRKMLMSTERS